ncbi:hypothetical protein DPMN_010774 [Dreissena polymorpha]|uniref:Uncharacterized protein n=1 Tax=Dreissena polymorpha TaxID=45954 RepID=A0A9D4N2C3_DREPO|nr:hypothetical protein DPMN_010774 [Dreissena polymorpha]
MRQEINVALLKPSRSTKPLTHERSLSSIDEIYTRGDTKSFDKENTDREPAFDGTQNEILVENIPDGVDEEMLEMSFSSRKLRSCLVTDIDFDENEMNAVIRFDRPSGRCIIFIYYSNNILTIRNVALLVCNFFLSSDPKT